MKIKLVVGYGRISTLEQKKGYGIDIQIRDIKRCARAHGLKIDKFFLDKSESGVEENRKELNKLMEECEAGNIKIVIIPSIDRLSRDVRIAENLFYFFERHNVKIIIADMPHYDDKNRKDVLIRQIKEAIAEENRKDIIERLYRGRQESVRQGKHPGGNIPYGYKRNSRGFEKNEKEIKIIEIIFSKNKLGLIDKEIADYLNKRGYKRRNRKPWTRRQVNSVLDRAELYEKGIFKYGEVRGKNKELIIFDIEKN